MATFYSKMSNYYQLKLEVTQKSQDVANNKTTLDWVLTLNMSHGYYFYDHQCTTLVKIGGVTAHSSDKRRSFSSATPTVLERGTVTIPHNSDGTLSAGIYANFDVARSSYTPQIPLVIDSSMPIPTIPRASTPTLDKSSVNYGDPVTIRTNRKSTAFTHVVKVNWNGITEIVARGVEISYSWYVPREYMSRIPNNTNTTGTIILETYNDSTFIGSKTVNLRTWVPSTIKPSITSLSVSEAAQGLAAKFGAYIQSKSQLLIKAEASGAYGSTIKSYQIIANGQTFGSASATTGYVRNSGLNKITVNITDSRGRTQSRSTTVDVLAYSSPRINLFDVYRCGPSGAAQANGDYARANYKGNVTSLGGKNDKAYTIKYKKKSNSTWTSLDLDNSSYMPDLYKVISGIDTKTSYDFRLEIADYFGIAYLTVSIGTASVFMDWAPEGRGLALNKYSEKEGLEVNWRSQFYQPVALDGGVIMQDTGDAGPGIDLNKTLDCRCMARVIANGPEPSGTGYYYLEQDFYNGSVSMSVERRQIVQNYYTGQMWTRVYSKGSWMPWCVATPTTTIYELSLLNGWVTHGSAWGTPRALKYGNVVTLDGMIRDGVLDGYKPFFVLPGVCRPRYYKTFSCALGSSQRTAFVTAQPNGTVYFDGDVAGSIGWLSLSNITFIVD
jgi:hypothetical protein